MSFIDKLLLLFFKAKLKRLIEYAVEQNDLEWYQIIESVLGFHPASKTDALINGIKKVKQLKNEQSTIQQ